MRPTVAVVVPVRAGSKGLDNKALRWMGHESLMERTLRQMHEALPEVSRYLYTDYTRAHVGPSVLRHASLMGRPPVDDDQTTEACLQAFLRAVPMVDVLVVATVTMPIREIGWVRACYDKVVGNWPSVDSSFVVEATPKQVWRAYPDTGTVRHRHVPWERVTSGTYGSRQTKAPEAYIEHTGVCLATKASVVAEGRRIGTVVDPVVVEHPYVGLDIHQKRDLEVARHLWWTNPR